MKNLMTVLSMYSLTQVVRPTVGIATEQFRVGKVQFSQPPDKIDSEHLPIGNIRRRTATGRFNSLCKFYPARFYQSFTAYLH